MEIKNATKQYDEVVFKCISKDYMNYDGEPLEKIFYIGIWISDNRPFTENCDSVIGYSFLFLNKEEIGGEMDFNSEEKKYQAMSDVINDVLEFCFDKNPEDFLVEIEETSLSRFDDFYNA